MLESVDINTIFSQSIIFKSLLFSYSSCSKPEIEAARHSSIFLVGRRLAGFFFEALKAHGPILKLPLFLMSLQQGNQAAVSWIDQDFSM